MEVVKVIGAKISKTEYRRIKEFCKEKQTTVSAQTRKLWADFLSRELSIEIVDPNREGD